MGRSLRSKCPPSKFLWAKQKRRNPTPAEAALWQAIRRKTLGVRVRRQSVIVGFIVDFYIPAAKLIVEVDGSYHQSQEARGHDKWREQILRGLGFAILRFTNQQVLRDLPSVLAALKAATRNATILRKPI